VLIVSNVRDAGEYQFVFIFILCKCIFWLSTK